MRILKKGFFVCLLVLNFAAAQDNESKVWDLLMNNKRVEARQLFDEKLASKTTSINQLILNGLIDIELGKLDFDGDLLSKILKTGDINPYLYPLWYQPFVYDRVNVNGFNDFTFQKIDELAADASVSKNPIVLYNKAIADRKRKNYDAYQNNIKKLNAIENWQFCGVFENLNDSGLEIEYEPERYAKNDKLFDANSNGEVGWYVPQTVQNEGYHFFSNEAEYGNGIMYSQVFVENPTDRKVILEFGASASIKIFLNDIEIYSNNNTIRTDLNAFLISFRLKKGVNRLLIKSAISGNTDYIFASLKDENQMFMNDLVFYNTYKPYQTDVAEEINVAIIPAEFESYFEAKIAKNPESILDQLLLFDGYTNNNKFELAEEIIEKLVSKYPNSSLLKMKQIYLFTSKGDTQKVEELSKNLEVSDPDYFFNIIAKIKDSNWVKNAKITEIETYRNKSKSLLNLQYPILYDFILASRNGDNATMADKIDLLMASTNNNEFYKTTFAYIFDVIKKDKPKTIAILENLLQERENFTAQNNLINYYKAADRKEDIKKLVLKNSIYYPYYNIFLKDAIEVLIDDKKFDEAHKKVDEALRNFPYSFQLKEKKGNIFNFQKNTKEAEKYYRASLSHNSFNSELRKKIYDITKTPDEIDEIDKSDKYKLIGERRKAAMKNDYGVIVLLDQYIVNVLPEGGRKSKVAFICEISAENGIEEMKEYKIDTSRNNFLKTEIVKPDGMIVPAEKGDNILVFSNLKVGDVIYIEYERYENETGRFYRDFNLACYFDSNYPSLETIFVVISPEKLKYETAFINGEIKATTQKVNNRLATIWRREKLEAVAMQENYAPNFNDLTNTIRVGTIKSWKEISNWYADLVKKTLKLDKITQNTFTEIFPNGTTGNTENEIAKKIYTYIANNITYSSLDFRQSGYVPQKPSKTINSKLGDCKDVSTLFVALAELAGLKSNLVLVKTNDNGFLSMLLPSNEFNHCIVKVQLDGKDTFLELTDKFLPFMALPTTLFNANALIISFDKNNNEQSKLINIPFENAIKNSNTATTIISIDEKSKNFKQTQTIQGASKSYYNQLFSSSITAEVRKKELEIDYNAKLKKVVSLQKDKVIQNKEFEKDITFETEFFVLEKPQSVGNLKITEIPFLDKVYTRDIISLENRKFEIDYFNYEAFTNYDNTIIINIEADKKFSEVPENKVFAFKNHSYSIQFELLKPNSISVKRVVALSRENISVEDYPDFKKYVEGIIEVEEQILGFK